MFLNNALRVVASHIHGTFFWRGGHLGTGAEIRCLGVGKDGLALQSWIDDSCTHNTPGITARAVRFIASGASIQGLRLIGSGRSIQGLGCGSGHDPGLRVARMA